jgi:hypothetical protein
MQNLRIYGLLLLWESPQLAALKLILRTADLTTESILLQALDLLLLELEAQLSTLLLLLVVVVVETVAVVAAQAASALDS